MGGYYPGRGADEKKSCNAFCGNRTPYGVAVYSGFALLYSYVRVIIVGGGGQNWSFGSEFWQ